MLAGYFALAAIAKSFAKTIPLWLLMLAAALPEVLAVALTLAGLENLRPDDPAAAVNVGYSHSLIVVLAIAVLLGVAGMRWGKQAGPVVAAVVLGHWLLDLLVLTGGLPLLPGGQAVIPTLGLGPNSTPALILGALLVLAGAFLYFRAAMGLPAPSIRSSGEYQTRALTAAGVTALMLLLALIADMMGLV